MHIANVVDQEAESVGLSKVLVTRVETVLNIVVDVALLVVIAIINGAQPLNQILNTKGHVVFLDVLSVVTLVTWGSPQLSLEVEVRLPSTSVVLDIVSKGCALNEGVLFFTVDEHGIVNLQVIEHFEGLSQGVRAVFEELILCDVGQDEMTVNRPRTDCCQHS